MKRYKLSDLHIGMQVCVDELYDIEGVYIVLSNTDVVDDKDGFTHTSGTITKISNKRPTLKHQKESLYFRRKGYAGLYEN